MKRVLLWLGGFVGLLAVLGVLVVAGATLFAAATFEGWGDFDPPPKPTAAEIERIREDSDFPVQWLGPSHGGEELRVAESEARDKAVRLSYGEAYCDSFDEVCNYEIDVVTSAHRATETEDPDTGERFPICWRRIGRALALGCDGDEPNEVEVFTGSVRVYIYRNTGSALRLAEGLRPMKGGRLAAPKPLTCRELRGTSERFRSRLPRELRGCREQR